jgi:hypothetical protein
MVIKTHCWRSKRRGQFLTDWARTWRLHGALYWSRHTGLGLITCRDRLARVRYPDYKDGLPVQLISAETQHRASVWHSIRRPFLTCNLCCGVGRQFQPAVMHRWVWVCQRTHHILSGREHQHVHPDAICILTSRLHELVSDGYSRLYR